MSSSIIKWFLIVFTASILGYLNFEFLTSEIDKEQYIKVISMKSKHADLAPMIKEFSSDGEIKLYELMILTRELSYSHFREMKLRKAREVRLAKESEVIYNSMSLTEIKTRLLTGDVDDLFSKN